MTSVTWCVTHKRDHARCKAGDGGILIPCRVVASEEIGRRHLAFDKECRRLLEWEKRSGLLVPHPITQEELTEALDLCYADPEERVAFLVSPQKLLDGLTPCEVIEAGRGAEVVRLLQQLAESVYL